MHRWALEPGAATDTSTMSESQEELLGVVTVAPTPERGVVTVAGTTAVASEGEGSGEEGCTGGHSSRELLTTLHSQDCRSVSGPNHIRYSPICTARFVNLGQLSDTARRHRYDTDCNRICIGSV